MDIIDKEYNSPFDTQKIEFMEELFDRAVQQKKLCKYDFYTAELLAKACKYGHYNIVKSILSTGININYRVHGASYIYYARMKYYYSNDINIIKYNKRRILELLEENGLKDDESEINSN